MVIEAAETAAELRRMEAEGEREEHEEEVQLFEGGQLVQPQGPT